MSWRDNLLPASFRGVPFGVQSHSAQPGARRLVEHTFPGRDSHQVEDLGRANGRFTITGFVDGEDYMAARDAIIDACQKAGSGKLVHPYLGELNVCCEDLSVSESSEEGRIARLTFTFVEKGQTVYPRALRDHASEVTAAADLAIIETEAQFTDRFSVAGLPGFIAEAAADISGQAFTQIDEIAAQALALDAAAIAADIHDALASLQTLVTEPAALARRLTGAISALGGAPINAAAQLSTFGGDLLPVPLTTATRQVQAMNQTALVSLVRGAALIEQVRSVPALAFSDRASALTLRDKLSDALDLAMDAASAAGADSLFDSLRGLRASMTRDVNARAPMLGRIVEVAAAVTEPALVTAYRLYGDAAKADEVTARNGLAHPGFVPGGRRIEAMVQENWPWR